MLGLESLYVWVNLESVQSQLIFFPPFASFQLSLREARLWSSPSL